MSAKKYPKPHGPVVVDAEDMHLLLGARWYRNFFGYAVTSARVAQGRRQQTVYLHRVITGAQVGQVVDHANGDILDNRRMNLRLCTHADNARNGIKPVSKTGYRGVSPSGRGYKAQICVNRKIVHLGKFADPADAARAYDAASLKMHGAFAVLNFSGRSVPHV